MDVNTRKPSSNLQGMPPWPATSIRYSRNPSLCELSKEVALELTNYLLKALDCCLPALHAAILRSAMLVRQSTSRALVGHKVVDASNHILCKPVVSASACWRPTELNAEVSRETDDPAPCVLGAPVELDATRQEPMTANKVAHKYRQTIRSGWPEHQGLSHRVARGAIAAGVEPRD